MEHVQAQTSIIFWIEYLLNTNNQLIAAALTGNKEVVAFLLDGVDEDFMSGPQVLGKFGLHAKA